MSTYIRFQTSVLCPRAKLPLGVFHATGVLEDEGKIEDYFQDPLKESLQWFNKNLAVPRITTKDQRCVFWFCADRQDFVARLWELVAILKEHEVEVRRVRTSDPGIIVYRDEYQVAAIPSQRINRALRV